MLRTIMILVILALPACATRVDRHAGAVPGATAGVIGRSVQGRAIEARTLGLGAHRVYLIGGIHGDEPEGLLAWHAVLAALLEPEVFRASTVRVVRDMNPDGSAARRRTNARGVDLNRNWPARNFRAGSSRGPEALSEPEAAAVFADLGAFDPDLVIVLHSSRSGPFVNFDGPGGELAGVFVGAAGPPWRVVPSMGYPTPGSLGSLIGVDRGVPILTVEFERGGASQGESVASGIRAVVTHDAKPPRNSAAHAVSAGTAGAPW